MADNLSVAVTAEFSAETRKLATDIRGGGDASGLLRSQLEAFDLCRRGIEFDGRFNPAAAAWRAAVHNASVWVAAREPARV
jgi:hypothetical protein